MGPATQRDSSRRPSRSRRVSWPLPTSMTHSPPSAATRKPSRKSRLTRSSKGRTAGQVGRFDYKKGLQRGHLASHAAHVGCHGHQRVRHGDHRAVHDHRRAMHGGHRAAHDGHRATHDVQKVCSDDHRASKGIERVGKDDQKVNQLTRRVHL